jgi:hypothetical protein
MNIARKKKEVSGSEQPLFSACCNTSARHNNFNGFLCCVIGRRKITNNKKLIGLLFIKLLPIDYNMYKVQEYDSTKGFKGLIFMSDNNINHPHPRSY